jgi:hypothetical protein
VGCWLYVAFTSRFNVLAFSLVHVLGAIGMGLAIWAFKKARQESRWLGTKQVMSAREFKHPQAADENRRNLKTHAAAGA